MTYEYVYLGMVCLLFILAISDLIVGVSNDAVNFLNSAIGSKAAPFYVTMIVASIGVLIGATFSSGMMEVARSGIFHPNQFYFNEIMLIFLAVMITDVVLLDLFNTFGMPTSTTVSLVFELLGSSVAISLVKIYNSSTETIANLGNYINTSKASAIVFSILISVLVGFIFGAFIQYIARLLFTFRINKTLKYFGAIWGAFCTCLITYFIFFKGLKGSPLISEANINFLNEHIWAVMGTIFICALILFQLLYFLFKVNPLKIIVMLGTFALAMAFAGNDLVNFIGVPMAGLSSFQIFQEAGPGVDPNTLSMNALSGKVSTSEIILILAGVIMIMTLWFSKKAKRVIKTTVNLSSSNQEDERFGSSQLSRAIVKMSVALNETIFKITPHRLSRFIKRRFLIPTALPGQQVAFDLVRASVNLMVAAALIALGTSLKLPLSTTYITFMVAMGSSLSDGAWGRENAVYRITGVFTVIGGWFITGIVAFTVSSIVATIIVFGGLWAIAGIIIMLVFSILRTHTVSKRQEKEKEKITPYLNGKIPPSEIHQAISENLVNVLKKIPDIYNQVIEGLDLESEKTILKAKKEHAVLDAHTKLMKNKVNDTIAIIQECSWANGHFYIQVVNYLRESLHSLSFVISGSYTHTDNRHKALLKDQIAELKEGAAEIQKFYDEIILTIENRRFENLEDILLHQQLLTNLFDTFNKHQMKRVKNGVSGTKNSLLYLMIISNTKNMILFSYLMAKAQREFEQAKINNSKSN